MLSSFLCHFNDKNAVYRNRTYIITGTVKNLIENILLYVINSDGKIIQTH
nr:MAG TPA: hypothetical protein [Caudoviricetes sp.]